MLLDIWQCWWLPSCVSPLQIFLKYHSYWLNSFCFNPIFSVKNGKSSCKGVETQNREGGWKRVPPYKWPPRCKEERKIVFQFWNNSACPMLHVSDKYRSPSTFLFLSRFDLTLRRHVVDVCFCFQFSKIAGYELLVSNVHP